MALPDFLVCITWLWVLRSVLTYIMQGSWFNEISRCLITFFRKVRIWRTTNYKLFRSVWGQFNSRTGIVAQFHYQLQNWNWSCNWNWWNRKWNWNWNSWNCNKNQAYTNISDEQWYHVFIIIKKLYKGDININFYILFFHNHNLFLGRHCKGNIGVTIGI